MKNSIVLATAVASVLTSGIAAADLSANAGVFSNYIWRGVTQTGDSAAGQGGVDWSSDSGLYAGSWVSTLGSGSGYELDLYGGFSGEASGFGYDLGVITYQYPSAAITGSALNFTELYAAGSMAGATVSIWYTVDKAALASSGKDDDIYLFAGYDFSASGIDYSVYVGDYNYDDDATTDYTHYGASMGKDGFGFAVDQNDMDGRAGDVRVTVSYSKDFAL